MSPMWATSTFGHTGGHLHSRTSILTECDDVIVVEVTLSLDDAYDLNVLYRIRWVQSVGCHCGHMGMDGKQCGK